MTTTISGSTGVNKITSDAIEYGDLPAGTILQVVSNSTDNSGSIATTSTSMVATGIQLNIVPKQTGSKLYISYVGSMSYQASGVYMFVRLYKDGVGLGVNSYSMFHNSASGGALYGSVSYNAVYTAGAAGTSVLYEPYFRTAGGDVRLAHDGSAYTLKITEVAV